MIFIWGGPYRSASSVVILELLNSNLTELELKTFCFSSIYLIFFYRFYRLSRATRLFNGHFQLKFGAVFHLPLLLKKHITDERCFIRSLPVSIKALIWFKHLSVHKLLKGKHENRLFHPSCSCLRFHSHSMCTSLGKENLGSNLRTLRWYL